MNNFLEDLKAYLAKTDTAEVLAAWERTAKADEVGPSFEEFLNHTRAYCYTYIEQPHDCHLNTTDNLSPKFASGFFLIKNKKNATASSLHAIGLSVR